MRPYTYRAILVYVSEAFVFSIILDCLERACVPRM